MIRRLVRALIENATVTHAAAPSLTVDPIILRAAEILPMEEVDLVNLATGQRVRTWVEAGAEASGEVRVPSSQRHPFRVGDMASIIAFGLLHDGQTLTHRARVVSVDPRNQVVAVTER